MRKSILAVMALFCLAGRPALADELIGGGADKGGAVQNGGVVQNGGGHHGGVVQNGGGHHGGVVQNGGGYHDGMIQNGGHGGKGDCYSDCYDSCCCGPNWTFRASLLYMDRATPNNQPLVMDAVTDEVYLDAGGFDFDWEPGIDVSAIWHRSACRSVEFRYMWLGDHSSQQTYTLAAPTPVVITTDPLTSFGGNDGGVATYESEMHSFEVNGRRTAGAVTWLAGFRYIDMADESVGMLLTFAGGGEASIFDADNDLFGFQLGAETSTCYNGITLTANGKAGLYYNDMETAFRLDRGVNGTVDAFANAEDEELAFVGEVGLFAAYPLTSNLAIRGGYHLLWLEGVAVGVEQVGATASYNANGEIDSVVDTGGIFYHGASIGLEYTY